MHIKMGEKLQPFSHTPGTRSVVPLGHWIVQAFPTLLCVEGGGEWPLALSGPIKDFTVQLDLERRCVWVWGIAKEGYFRFSLSAGEEGLALTVTRAPSEGLQIGSKRLFRKEKILLVSGGPFLAHPGQERISLGSFKAQDWDLVQRRMDLKEMIPALFLLGQQVSALPEAKGGSAELLETDLDAFLQAGFSGLLVPRLSDDQHQGLVLNTKSEGNTLALLPALYRKVRSFLLEGVRVLPHLPRDWDCGRALRLNTGFGELDLEWSKRTIRRMVLRAQASGEVSFVFSKPVGSFRCGHARFENGSAVALTAGKTYLFDRFQK